MPLKIYTDGGSRGNPGRSACAFYIPEYDIRVGVPLPDTTNNVAEYQGLIHGLDCCVRSRFLNIECVADSELVVKQMNGVYSVKSESLLKLWIEAQRLVSHLESFSISHVKREGNPVADKLCNLTMDLMEKGHVLPTALRFNKDGSLSTVVSGFNGAD